MFLRVFRSGIKSYRLFGELQKLSQIAGTASPLDLNVEIDFDSFPLYTLGSYDTEMNQVLLDYIKSIKSIAGGRYTKSIFDTITVYSFMEHVPLTRTADVDQMSDTGFKITAFDPTNSPMIEIALKKSPYKMDVKRDFDKITVDVKIDLEASKATLGKITDDAKKKIENIVKNAAVRFTGNKEATGDIESMSKKFIQDIDSFYSVKLEKTSL